MLSELFTNNYDYLNTVAKRITRKRDQRMAPELLSTTYLVLHEKHGDNPPIKSGNDDFVKWFCKSMKNNYSWGGSEFNKCYRNDNDEKERLEIKDRRRYLKKTGVEQNLSRSEDNFRGELDISPEGVNGIIDEGALIDMELFAEETNSATREFIEISSSLGRAKTMKYLELIEFKRSLPAHESILFELYFEKEMSTRDIAKEYSMEFNIINYQSINRMVNIIKSKIRKYEWKQLNS